MARSKKLPLECPAIIGREAELETLEQLLAEAAAGSGRLALISGADGVGRTCLLTELQRRAQPRTASLWLATGWPYDALRPYATLLRLGESASVGAEGEREGDSDSTGVVALQRAVATVAAHVAAETPPWDVFASAAPLDPGDERRRCVRLLLDGLRQVSASGPVLIALDDAHLADEMTWAFLCELAPLLPRLPLLVVLAYRDEPAPPDALLATIAALARWTEPAWLPLAPLAPGESAALARALLPPRESLSPTLEAALFAVARGQPYAVASLLAVWRAEEAAGAGSGGAGADGVGAIPLPQSAREAVRWHMARLSARARDRLAELVITRGEPATWHAGTGLLGESSGSESSEGESTERAAEWHELWAAGLLARGEATDAARGEAGRPWPHALTCEAVLAELAPAERARWQRAAMERLARLEGPWARDAWAVLAEHAFAVEDWELALASARQAGERALALAAPRAAAALLTRALDAAAALNRTLPELLCARGEAYRQLGELERARADGDAALAQAREGGNRPAEWRALHDQGVLWMGRDYARTGQCLERSYTVARALDEPTALVASLNRLGIWHLNMDRPQDALREHRKALAILRANERMADAGETLFYLGIAALTGGEPARAARCLVQAIPLLREGNQQQRLSSSLATLAICGLAFQTEFLVFVPGDQLDGVRYAEMAVATARQIGWQEGEAYALLSLASCLGPRGDFARALELAHQALRIAEEIEHAQWTVAALWMLGALYRALMVLPSAATYLERGWRLAREIGSWHWQRVNVGYLATVHIIEGNFAQAEALLDATEVVDAPPRSFGQQCVMCARIDLALARGEPRLALEMTDAMLAQPAEGLPMRPIPRLARLRGDALAALGRRAEAEATLRGARQEAITQGALGYQWYLESALARLLHGQGRDGEATRMAQSARANVEALAAQMPDASLGDALRQRALGMLPPSSSPASRRALKEAFDGLTAREREVAALIAQGKSNRAIAEALVVSERTAETHVGNILKKLNFSSRAQIAAWAAEKLHTAHEDERPAHQGHQAEREHA